MFVVPQVCRFQINGILVNRTCTNVLDMQIDTTGSSMSRLEAIQDQAAIIVQEWEDSILPLLVDDYTAQSVGWVDLNSASGSTGETTTGSGAATWPTAGSVSTAPLPGNTSALITKQILAERGRRNGRMFMAGLSEAASSDVNPNTLTAVFLDAAQDALNAFKGDVEQSDPGPTEYTSRLAVVHVLTREPPVTPGKPGNPLTGDFKPVNNLVLAATLATQRRRLR